MVNFKKFISIVMIVCLVVSMSTMAFAAKTSLSKENTVVVHNEDGDLLVSYDPHMYVDAKDAVAMTNSVDGKEVAYGKTVYIPLVDESGNVVSTSSAVSALKVTGKWTANGKYVKSVELIKKEGAYMIAISTEGSDTKDRDVEGTIVISGKAYAATASDAKKVKVDKTEIDVTITLAYEGVNSGDDYTVTDTGRLFKFSDNRDTDMCDEEFEFTFEEFDDVTFTVDTTHQGDIVMRADDDAIKAVEDANPAANMDFYNFHGASFRKSGSLFLPAPKDSFVYEFVNNELVLVNAVYDTFDEGFYVKTKVLGNYVVSDVALVSPVAIPADGDVSVVSDNPVNANPSTGAAV